MELVSEFLYRVTTATEECDVQDDCTSEYAFRFPPFAIIAPQMNDNDEEASTPFIVSLLLHHLSLSEDDFWAVETYVELSMSEQHAEVILQLATLPEADLDIEAIAAVNFTEEDLESIYTFVALIQTFDLPEEDDTSTESLTIDRRSVEQHNIAGQCLVIYKI